MWQNHRKSSHMNTLNLSKQDLTTLSVVWLEHDTSPDRHICDQLKCENFQFWSHQDWVAVGQCLLRDLIQGATCCFLPREPWNRTAKRTKRSVHAEWYINNITVYIVLYCKYICKYIIVYLFKQDSMWYINTIYLFLYRIGNCNYTKVQFPPTGST